MSGTDSVIAGTAEAVLELLPTPVIIVDPWLAIVNANHAATRLFERPPEAILGTSLLAFFPDLAKDASEERSRMPADLVLHALVGRSTMTSLNAGRRRRSVELAIEPPTEQTRGFWILTAHDMTAIEESHADLLQTHRELEEFNRIIVDRELRMIELKREVNALSAGLGRPAPYPDVDGF